MDEILAANDREIATPEGAANIGEDAPLPSVPQEAKESEDGKGWTRKVAQRIKEERQKAQQELQADIDREEAAFYAELALAADPDLGGYYLALEGEVQALAAQYDADVESAFLLVLKQHLPRLLREERQKGEQELLTKLAANAVGPGSLADASAQPAGLAALSDAEFAAMVQKVKLAGRT